VFAFMVCWTVFSLHSVYIDWTKTISEPEMYLPGAFSVFGIGVLIWLIFCRETITFQAQSITVCRGMFGIGRHRRFSSSDVHDMRLGSFLDPNALGKWHPDFVHSSICFEYRGKTQRLGNELGQIEGQRIAKAIRQHHPQMFYAPANTASDRVSHKHSKPHSGYWTMPRKGLDPFVLLLSGLGILWGFGFDTVGRRLEIQVDGVVTSSLDIPATRGPRYATEYTLRGPGGQNHIYVAGPTDASLPRSMPVGTYLKKPRWHLDYWRNKQRVDDFPIFFYQAVLGIALGCVVGSVILWRGQRQPR
jgi:hypothetical protein